MNAIPLNATPLNDQQQLRLNKINKNKDYFITEIEERELMSKRFSKHISSFDYFDKSFIVLSLTTAGISIASFGTVIGAPVGIVRASFSLAFLIFKVNTKKLLKTRRNKKKHNKTVMLARSKLNTLKNKANLIEGGEKIGIDEVIKHNEIIDERLKSQL